MTHPKEKYTQMEEVVYMRCQQGYTLLTMINPNNKAYDMEVDNVLHLLGARGGNTHCYIKKN